MSQRADEWLADQPGLPVSAESIVEEKSDCPQPSPPVAGEPPDASAAIAVDVEAMEVSVCADVVAVV